MSYYAFNFNISPLDPYRDMLLFYLNEIGFESHRETDHGLESFIQVKDFDSTELDDVIANLTGAQVTFEQKEIAQQNWNAIWESNFEPVWINDQCVICADFHDVDDVAYKIRINPKMAFGTGHHETTSMICQQLFEENVAKADVLDMGCGTAVLGILSIKLGANRCDAIDIDDWAVSNARENVLLNDCPSCTVDKGDATVLGDQLYNAILANINKNVLLDEMEAYASVLKPNGMILFSGFYKDDVEDIVSRGNVFGLSFVSTREKNNWAMVKMIKSN